METRIIKTKSGKYAAQAYRWPSWWWIGYDYSLLRAEHAEEFALVDTKEEAQTILDSFEVHSKRLDVADIEYGDVEVVKGPVRTYNFNRKLFEEAAKPLMKYLNENHHPMTKIIIETDSAEVVEGCMSFRTEEFIKD